MQRVTWEHLLLGILYYIRQNYSPERVYDLTKSYDIFTVCSMYYILCTIYYMYYFTICSGHFTTKVRGWFHGRAGSRTQSLWLSNHVSPAAHYPSLFPHCLYLMFLVNSEIPDLWTPVHTTQKWFYVDLNVIKLAFPLQCGRTDYSSLSPLFLFPDRLFSLFR